MKRKLFYITDENVSEEIDVNSPLLIERWGKEKYKPCKEDDVAKRQKRN